MALLKDSHINDQRIILVEHKCVLCEATLESKETLQEHFRKHANKEIDGRGRAKTNESPKKLEKKDLFCDICSKAFDSKTATIRHRFKMHPNSLTKFYCNYCGMMFPLENHRDSHLSSHDPEESKRTSDHEICDDCGIVFYNRKALDYHYKSMHKRLVHMFQPVATPPPSNKIKINSMNDALSVYYCHICGVEYVVKFNLQQHLEKVHSREERECVPENFIKCTVCSALFCSNKAYLVHNSYHQSNDLYVTSEEQRLQTITRIDQDFDSRRVKTPVDEYIMKLTSRRRPLKREQINAGDFLKVTINEGKKSSSGNCSSDSESDVPLQKRLGKI